MALCKIVCITWFFEILPYKKQW